MKSIVSLPNNEIGILFAALLARNFKVLKSPSRHTATVPAQEPTPRHDKCGGAACGCIVLPKWLPKNRDYLHGGGKCLTIRHIAYGCRCFGSRDTVDVAANACRCAVRNMSVVSHSFLHLSESESKIVWENNTHNW